jgi:hypothetical protein
VSLLGALAAVAWRPELLAGGLLAPQLVGIVHLLTLGFVTATILGSLYLVSPFALRARMGERPGDLVAFSAYAVGTFGLAEAFASGEIADGLLSSLPVVAALLWVAGRSLGALRASRLSTSWKVPFGLAWTGLAATLALGLLHALDGSGRLLGGTVSDRVAAHAHLGLAGWALVVVMAAGNRLFPMLLPAAMPMGTRIWLPACLAFSGASLHAAGRIGSSRIVAFTGALVLAAGVVGFLANLSWMLRHRRQPASAVPHPDLPRLGALSSMLSLAVVTGTGLALASGVDRPGLLAAYGVLMLLGFFAQLILAMEQRLVPWLLWMRAYAASGYLQSPPTPYRLPLPWLHSAVTGVWAVGPWALAIGALAGSPTTIQAASLALALATVAHGLVLARYAVVAYGSAARPRE